MSITFTEKELELLHHLSNGNDNVDKLSASMGISKPETYRAIRMLRSKDVLDDDKSITISKCAFAKRLFLIMSEGKGMSRFFSDKRLDVLMSLMKPKSLESISISTGLSQSYIRKVLSVQTKGGMVQNISGVYRINDDMYPKVRPFLESLSDHLEMFDARIPRTAEIIERRNDEVIYSVRGDTDDEPTGFSAFEEYGIKGFNLDRTYHTTVNEKPSMDKVFRDAFTIAEKENDWRLRMELMLFFEKNRKQLKAPPGFLSIYNRIIAGHNESGWPSKDDLEDRRWVIRND